MKRLIAFVSGVVFLSVMTISCSLNYEQNQKVDEILPEFTLKNAVITRYENNNLDMNLKIGQLEQFKDGVSMYASDVVFALYENREISTEGNCRYLSADTRKEIYELFDSIRIINRKQNLVVSGRSFHWNGKTEQLTAGKNDTVVIEKDGMTIHGSGFAASGISSSFVFSSIVTGNIETD